MTRDAVRTVQIIKDQVDKVTGDLIQRVDHLEQLISTLDVNLMQWATKSMNADEYKIHVDALTKHIKEEVAKYANLKRNQAA